MLNAEKHDSLNLKSGVIDGSVRDKLLVNEDMLKDLVQKGDYCKAFLFGKMNKIWKKFISFTL